MARWLEADAIEQVWRFRHACKQYDASRTIPEHDWEAILTAARLSPSSFGFEPWHFLVLQNRAVREALLPIAWGAQGQFPTASHVVAILARKDVRWDSPYLAAHMLEVKRLDDATIDQRQARVRNFQEREFKLLETPTGLFEWSARQCYLALASMMTAAALLGIDSCPIEGFDREQAEAILSRFHPIDWTTWGLAVFVAFGYRVVEPPEKTRWPKDKTVTVL